MATRLAIKGGVNCNSIKNSEPAFILGINFVCGYSFYFLILCFIEATKNNFTAIVKALIQLNSTDVNIKDNNNFTALMLGNT